MLEAYFEKLDPSSPANWRSRKDRSRFVRDMSEKLKVASVLNVGSGGKRELASISPDGLKVFDIDMEGECDLKLNLDAVDALPFGDSEYDLVCAMDVLEHLEKFHHTSEELLRVSNKYVLISLPNSAAEFLGVARNRLSDQNDNSRGYFSKYYGIPVLAPMDRHRWWMYPQDIVRYFETFAKHHNCKVTYFGPTQSISRRLLRLLIGKRLYTTFFLSHVALLIEK